MPDAPDADEVVIGGRVARVQVSLRFVHDDLDPDRITTLLGQPPTFAAAKGTRRQSRGRELVQRTGVWSHQLAAEPTERGTLPDAIRALLSRFPSDVGVWRELRALATGSVFCGLFLSTENQGAALSPKLLADLAERGLTLDLDIYGRG